MGVFFFFFIRSSFEDFMCTKMPENYSGLINLLGYWKKITKKGHGTIRIKVVSNAPRNAGSSTVNTEERLLFITVVVSRKTVFTMPRTCSVLNYNFVSIFFFLVCVSAFVCVFPTFYSDSDNTRQGRKPKSIRLNRSYSNNAARLPCVGFIRKMVKCARARVRRDYTCTCLANRLIDSGNGRRG